MVNASISTKNTYLYLIEEVGGSENVGFTKKDCYNHVNTKKMSTISAGDAQNLLNHFKKRQIEDPMFFYTIQVDQENRMTNFFGEMGDQELIMIVLEMLWYLTLLTTPIDIVGSTFGRFFTVRQMSPNPTGPIQ